MPLIPNKLFNSMKAHLLKTNEKKQEDVTVSIEAHCKQLEQDVYNAIKSITIVIPAGAIIVQTSQGPAANVSQIVLESTVK
ncbi:hypothetical protein ACTJJ0_30820 [Chitinophaga sp. 22321]|uniref:Uncharacterized protein n=1 Tax=Chitinophaga hostae TaxID=2831022 RepID=A0ABS5J8R3_9BACT|nr:hypothetical protein [Chitinophaga hostae]MBS0031610.1 hypothetical protein [Chitinophaga hostae]